MYRDVTIAPPGLEPERSVVDKANDKIEGRDESSYNEDGLRTVFEIYATTSLSDDDEPSPYIISVDKTSRTVLSIYRNWDELDDSREELQWFVEFPFIPWRGAYPIGLPHIIGRYWRAACADGLGAHPERSDHAEAEGRVARRPVAQHPADAGRGDRGRPQRRRHPQDRDAAAVQPALADPDAAAQLHHRRSQGRGADLA